MWSFFKQKKGKGPILSLPRTQSIYYGTNAVHIFLLYGIMFLLKLNLVIQFSNLKPKSKIWETLTVDV